MIIKRVDESVIEQFFKNDYHDRGMLKWGGFFLSDHTSAIKKMKHDKIPEKWLPEQTLEKNSQTLKQAWLHKQVVHVQLKLLHDGETLSSLTGQVAGFHDQKIIFSNVEGQLTAVSLEEIRNVHRPEVSVDWRNFN
ncbi:YolD-like family protein [Pediococcus ethanolidurans]|uniref:DNA-directed RNA polymerase beta subunit n=1 Tax=Pediococcus ethanolidurans TaxID=319653 RepID=A0A0R2KBN4_9LACO|nr:hypothetical protein [Pediococcus ethanolidurans]KRN83677.1 hypothetical protein IV87_GL000146 [Pediococcus ethanolidurans]MBU7554852.1 hypothetical protein [Pediococcus ethanolidurans]MBU7563225.1 hypothetical protein [Pediococcus ethanolidurans]MCV3315996.1 hypothetical protein [Pediococcus ethanolidurans]MCV3321819.1 hypothetical protein [Pediococcus ethanolidurans]